LLGISGLEKSKLSNQRSLILSSIKEEIDFLRMRYVSLSDEQRAFNTSTTHSILNSNGIVI
jgi:hypothetical protein